MAFLFSSLKSPFVILKVPLCLCLCRQLAAALLKIAGGGNRSAPHIKNRKGSTGVNNACERIPLPPAPRVRGGPGSRQGPAGPGRIRASLCWSLGERASHKLQLAPQPAVGREG